MSGVFALAAIATEIHDIVITIGAISLFDIDVNLDTLAAVLTVLGYSLNDTIIIFDRIREGIKESKRTDIEGVINESVSATLSRTILTSATTMMTVLVLFLFAGDMIHGFSFILIVGIVIGTISRSISLRRFLSGLNLALSILETRETEKQRIKKSAKKSVLCLKKALCKEG